MSSNIVVRDFNESIQNEIRERRRVKYKSNVISSNWKQFASTEQSNNTVLPANKLRRGINRENVLLKLIIHDVSLFIVPISSIIFG